MAHTRWQTAEDGGTVASEAAHWSRHLTRRVVCSIRRPGERTVKPPQLCYTEKRHQWKSALLHKPPRLPTWQQVPLTTKAFETEPGCSLFSADRQLLHSQNTALCQREQKAPVHVWGDLRWYSITHTSLTFRTELADFLHVVLGAVVDGMCDSTLADGLVLAGWRRAEHSYVLHRLAQLSGGDANTTWRQR